MIKDHWNVCTTIGPQTSDVFYKDIFSELQVWYYHSAAQDGVVRLGTLLYTQHVGVQAHIQVDDLP